MVSEYVPTIHEYKWGYAKTTLYFDITTVYYVSLCSFPLYAPGEELRVVE